MAIPINTSMAGPVATASAAGAGNARGGNIHEIALSLHARRLQLISSNIANADTPNYRAVDVDFRDTLRQAAKTIDARGPQSIIAMGGPAARQSTVDYVIQYHTPIQRSADGNTVDLDQERAKFTDAAVRYQFALDRVSGHYKDMEKLLNNLPY